ncbi:putative reverse transcriptase domain-containing protein [Tanacetum coccineum]
MRINIPEFNGDTLNPEGFIDWLVVVEEVFEFKEVPENKRGSLIATKLRGRASAWWKQLKLTRERVGKPRITSWQKMKKCASGSGNAVSRFAPNQAKAGGGNTRPVPNATGSSGLKYFNCSEPGHRQSECKKAGKRHLFVDPEDDDDDVAHFKDELEMGDYIFVLIGKEVAGDSEILEAMIPLLEEFTNVFPDELPDGLPPLHDIHNHIDLVPVSQFPNRLHYRISSGEHEELRRQVKELVSKGYVHESMILCVVPALLTPKKDDT